MQFEAKEVNAAIAWAMGESAVENYTELGSQAAYRFLAWARPQIDKMTDIERGVGTAYAFLCSSCGEVIAFASLLGIMTKWTAHQVEFGGRREMEAVDAKATREELGHGANMPKQLFDLLQAIPQQPQRQDGANDQLADLAVFAVRLGLYDAADYINTVLKRR